MFGSLYQKIFVNIVQKRSTTIVYIEILSGKNIVKSVEESFETKSINEKMLIFINKYISESPYYYVALLDSSSAQGAIPTCSKKLLGQYQDVSSSEYRCFEEKWSYFTAASTITTLKRQYRQIGIDFIFSPFVLIAQFFKDKIGSNKAMYVLIEEGFLSIAIFENSELLFAKHIDVQINKDDFDVLVYEDTSDMDFDLDDSIDLEDVSAEYMDELEDFTNIEDLDAIEDIVEFSDSKDIEEDFEQENLKEINSTPTKSFNEEYQRFSLIQETVKSYYSDDKYQSSFVESVYIADGVGVSEDLKRFLEEEMFLSVYVRKIDLSMQICELAKGELGR